MKAFVAWSLLGLATVGMVGCGANIPAVEEIDANPKADPDAMRKSMKDMEERMKATASKSGKSTPSVDIDKQVEQSTGGGN